MSYFRYEGKLIYYEESGEGSPLILLHGNTSCGKMVESFIADSFEGLNADHEITEHIRNGRAQAKTFSGFAEYLKTLHGDDWERVFDADTDAVLRHSEQIGEFFHKSMDEFIDLFSKMT